MNYARSRRGKAARRKRNHPAVRMGRGYEEALGACGIAIYSKWCQRRGYAGTGAVKITEGLAAAGVTVTARPVEELRRAG
jgi:hypothetical protein